MPLTSDRGRKGGDVQIRSSPFTEGPLGRGYRQGPTWAVLIAVILCLALLEISRECDGRFGRDSLRTTAACGRTDLLSMPPEDSAIHAFGWIRPLSAPQSINRANHEEEISMATYVITDNARDGWENGLKFKYRHTSRKGHSVAQDEFDRRRAAGQKVVLWRWEHGEPTIVERYRA